MENGLYRLMVEAQDNILMVHNLRVWFPLRRSLGEILRRKPGRHVRAVDGITFNVRKNETFCLVGESGCGKTTTGKALLRLVPIRSGVALFRPKNQTVEELKRLGVNAQDGIIDIMNIPFKKLKPLRKEIQLIYQDPFGSLNPRYTIKAILEEPLKIHKIKMSEEEKTELIHKTLEEVKLKPPEDFVSRYPHQLSGGQRQRVAIAKAMILRPRLVVADEPVSMLDVSIRAEILELMENLKGEYGLSYIFITHDLAVARYICSRIAVMYLGRIVEMGDAKKIIEEPLHPYTRALVAAIPEPDPNNRFRIRELPIKGEVPNAVDIPSGCRFHPRCVSYEKNMNVLRRYCPVKEPPYFISDDGRIVSCWLYRDYRKVESLSEMFM